MADRRPSTILIDLGDLPSLVAAVTQVDPAGLVIWHPQRADPAAPRRLAMVRRHAEVLEPAEIVVGDPTDALSVRAATAEADDGDELLDRAIVLTQAARLARRLRCARVVWPIQAGPDPDAVCRLVDCATTVVDLSDLASQAGAEGTATGSIVIETPLVDLNDDQILDLADDAGAPLGAFWPCEQGTTEPCGFCPGCDRWHHAFNRAAIPWPGAMATERAAMAKVHR